MKLHRSGVLIACGILLLLGAAALAGVNRYQDREGQSSSQVIEKELRKQIPAGQAPGVVSAPDTILIDGEPYCGILEIPKIDLSLPVAADYSMAQMKTSLVRYRGDLAAGDMIICGHNTRSFFGSLSKVFEGDAVYFLDGSGITHEFVVSEVQTIGGYEVPTLLDGGAEWDLSVFTCTYSGRSRYVLRCRAAGEAIERDES